MPSTAQLSRTEKRNARETRARKRSEDRERRIRLFIDAVKTPPVGTLAGLLAAKGLGAAGVFSPTEQFAAAMMTGMATTQGSGPLGVGIVALLSAFSTPGLTSPDVPGGGLGNILTGGQQRYGPVGLLLYLLGVGREGGLGG